MAMGAETCKFKSVIFIRTIDRTCYWSASEYENESREEARLNIKGTSKITNKITNEQNSKRNTRTTYTYTKFIVLSFVGKWFDT